MVKKLSEKCIDSFLEHRSILTFYEEAAKECGLRVTENSVFDCTRIRIAENILEKWKRDFTDHYGQENVIQLMQHLCLFGPKAAGDLKDNEAEISKGFLSEKEDAENESGVF